MKKVLNEKFLNKKVLNTLEKHRRISGKIDFFFNKSLFDDDHCNNK